ncbi:hypothetical protein NM688_g2020 [Phlebia brevispora]|uniref:Uncharacterized protein n=1 Tax=Phlebia brevispora TaxID=194682 RepID=A0ACC1T9V2_9APHY|nr:hypothetical protein NM688_g2020 [Phlebia brevispora]
MDWAYTQVIAGLLLATALCLFYSLTRSSASRRLLPLPPGPDAAWYTPGPKMPMKFAELGDIYGPVFSYRRGKEVVCVINRHEAAMEILQKQGADTVDRPRAIAANEILSGGDAYCTDRRRSSHQKASKLQLSTVGQYQPLQMRNARTYVLDLLRKPDEHISHAKRYAASVVMSMTYGKLSTSYADPEIQALMLYMIRFTKCMQFGKHLVDNYPFLRYVPFVTSELRKWHQDELGLYRQMLGDVRQKMAAHAVQPCFASYLLERQEEYDLKDNELAYLAGAMFAAGSETTSSAIAFMLMAAAKFPEEAAKVRKQLDDAVGRDRLPTFEDIKALPRVRAFFWETFRWRPVFWGGIAHRAMRDVIWKEYVIPEGAIIIGNHWGIGLDPDAYPDPHTFKPDRWLDADGNFNEDMTFCNYGFGRRFCVGQYLANKYVHVAIPHPLSYLSLAPLGHGSSMFITTALALWSFDMREDPESPIDTMAFEDSATIRPHPFKIIFEPRIDNLQEIVESHTD